MLKKIINFQEKIQKVFGEQIFGKKKRFFLNEHFFVIKIQNMKNLKTSKVSKLKCEHFLKYMLCVLRPAEGAAYEKRDFTTMSSNYW